MATQDLGKYSAAVRANGVRLNSSEPLIAAGTVTLPSGTTIGGVLNSQNEYVSFTALAATNFAASTNYPIFVVPNDGATWKVVAVSYRFSAQAGSAATFTVEVTPSGTAMGSGTAQTGNLTLQGTTNTVINGTLTASTTLAAGSQLTLVVGSTATTSLANLEFTAVLQRVS